MPRLPQEIKTEETALLEQLHELITAPGKRSGSGRWKMIEEFPEDLDRGPNIRAKNPLHIVRLAISIVSQGQLENCVGDTLPSNRNRVWAGQHRYDAVQLIDEVETASQGSKSTRLRVRTWTEEFTPAKALEVQIAENLQEPMRSEEKARVIQELFVYYQGVHGVNASRAQFAREIGRGEGEVRAAVRFMSLDQRVQTLVADDCFTYSFAVDHLGRLPKVDQFATANHIILNGLKGHKAIEYINSLISQASLSQFSLFGGQEAEGLAQQNFRLSLRTAADRSAQDAAGYFVRVLKLLKQTSPHDSNRVSDTIEDILAAFMASSDTFRDHLLAADQEIGEQVTGRAAFLVPSLQPRLDMK